MKLGYQINMQLKPKCVKGAKPNINAFPAMAVSVKAINAFLTGVAA